MTRFRTALIGAGFISTTHIEALKTAVPETELVAIVDRNRLQQGARTEDTNRLEPLSDRWRAFGWDVVTCDGHDHGALYEAFTAPHLGKPRCVIANTIKGKGVSFIEDRVEWHHKVPTQEQIELALKELV